MTKPTFRTYDVIVEPGATDVINRAASFLSCLEASHRFQIMFDDGTACDFEQGLTFRQGSDFKQVQITNPSATDTLTVKLGLGRGDIRDSRLSLTGQVDSRQKSPDVLGTGAPVTATDANTTELAAANPLRREILVVNTSPGATVYIGGDAGAGQGQGLPILPSQSLTLETAAAVYARNDSGGDVAVAVAELEWSA